MSGTEGVTAEMFKAGIAEVKQCLVGISSELAEVRYLLQSIERNIKYLQDYTFWGFMLPGVFILLIGSVILMTIVYSIKRDETASQLSCSEIQTMIDEAVAKALTAKK